MFFLLKTKVLGLQIESLTGPIQLTLVWAPLVTAMSYRRSSSVNKDIFFLAGSQPVGSQGYLSPPDKCTSSKGQGAMAKFKETPKEKKVHVRRAGCRKVPEPELTFVREECVGSGRNFHTENSHGTAATSAQSLPGALALSYNTSVKHGPLCLQLILKMV